MRDTVVFTLMGAATIAGWWVWGNALARGLCLYFGLGFLACGIAYAVNFPAIWGKRPNGTISWINYVLFSGLHVIHWIAVSTILFFRRTIPCQLIAPNVWLGRLMVGGEDKIFGSPQVAVLDLTSEFPENPRLRRGNYLCIPLLDRTAPTRDQMGRALAFIKAHAPNEPFYVHCARGRGRSATVAAAWLLANHLEPDVDTAIASLKNIRSAVHLEPCQRAILMEMYPCK